MIAVVVLLAGCDLTVTNPGPVQDEFLNDEGAYPAVLQGVRRGHAMAYTRLALDAAMMSFEGVPGGLFDTQFKQGILTSDNSNGNWNGPQRARWLAENGVERIREALGSSFTSSRSTTKSRTRGSRAITCLGVKRLITSLRSAV